MPKRIQAVCSETVYERLREAKGDDRTWLDVLEEWHEYQKADA